jgi:hypothetical protein
LLGGQRALCEMIGNLIGRGVKSPPRSRRSL